MQITSSQLSLDKGVIDVRRVFVYGAFCQLIALALMLTGNYMFIAGFAAVLLSPLLVLLIPIEPLIGLPLMLIATGFDASNRISARSGEHFSLTYFHIAMLVTFVAVLMNMLLTKRTRIPYATFLPSVLSFLVMMAFSLLYSPNFTVGFFEVIRIAVLVLLAYSMIVCIDNSRRAKIAAWICMLIPTLVSAYTIYEILTEGSFFASGVRRIATELGMPVYRSTGTFANPNTLACFLMVGIVIGFGLLLLRSKNWLTKLIIVVMISTTSIALISSFSRSGWLSTMTAVFLIILIHRRWRYLYIFSAILVIVLIVLTIKFPHILLSVFDRFSSILNPLSEDSSSSRIAMIKTGIWIWQDHPLFGVGAGSHAYYSFRYMDPSMPLILSNVVEPHTLQIKILVEEGIIGFAIASWFFFTVLYDGLRSLRTMASDYLKHVQIALIALFVGFIVNFTFGADMFNNTFWICIGIMYAIPFADANEQARSRDLPAASGPAVALTVE